MYILRALTKNLGDSLNVPLVECITGETPRTVRHTYESLGNTTIYMVIGSILPWANEHTIVWGAGFISEESKMLHRPKKVCAVRGPESRRKLLSQGIDCPDVYGDPALLYSRFYTPKETQKKYKLGIIPHYVDKKVPLLKKFRDNPDILVIDVQKDVNRVIDDICSCERVASSCLHGIICADAYGVPSTWIKFSDNVIGKGFKFRDYFASVGRKDTSPLVMREDTTVQQILDRFYDYKIDIDLDRLYEVCPFR